MSARSFGRPQVEKPTTVRLPRNGVRGNENARNLHRGLISSNGTSGQRGESEYTEPSVLDTSTLADFPVLIRPISSNAVSSLQLAVVRQP